MVVVIAMAGEGKRFAEIGIREPKYAIVARGKPLFDWALSSVAPWFERAQFRFVARQGVAEFINERCRVLGIRSSSIVALSAPTDGQATTVLNGIEDLDAREAMLIYNIDTHLIAGALSADDIDPGDAGWVALFRAPGTHWSFASLDPNGRVLDVSEKVRISDFASIGLYYFQSIQLFEDAYKARAASTIERYGELYVMPLYHHLLEQGLPVGSTVVRSDEVIPLGTPEELARFDPVFRDRISKHTSPLL